MCRDRAGKWKLAEIMEIRELKEHQLEEEELDATPTKRFKQPNPEESKKEETENPHYEM